MKTYVPKPDEVKRDWVVVDASNQVLGRLATEIGQLGRDLPVLDPQPFVEIGSRQVAGASSFGLRAGRRRRHSW